MSDDVRLGLIAGGVLAVLGALLWRYLSRRRAVRVLLDRLGADDPQERARGGILLVDLGLSRAARPLLKHVATEPDPRARLAIALAIGRRQWEPSNATRVTRLREWAALELEQQGQPVSPFGPAVTRLSDMGGPRLPETEPTPGETPLAVAPEPGLPEPGGADGTIRWGVDGGPGTA
jgi:hypothetical protein